MNLKKIYIRTGREGFPATSPCYQAFEGFCECGVETSFFNWFGEIVTLSDLGPEVGLHGYVGDVHAALLKLGKTIPGPLDYPDSLYKYLGRHIVQTTLGNVRSCPVGIFVKPVQHKLFSGFVWKNTREDRLRLAPYGDDVQVWTSSIVEFKAEFRAFILNGEIIDVRRYKGDPYLAPSKFELEAMVKSYEGAPAAYAIDVGVRGTGSLGDNLLVEVNDAFSLGTYGLNSVLYAKMIDARWKELAS